MDDTQRSHFVEEPVTLPLQESEADEAGTKGESNVVDFQTAAAESREVRVQTTLVALREYQTKFQTTFASLNDAALKIREQTEVSFRQCKDVVKVLQELRCLTNECLEIFRTGNVPFVASYYCVTNSLSLLDGEKTARLILEVDLFEDLLHRKSTSSVGGSESLTHARERIKMHVDLQSTLWDEGRQVQELIRQIEKLLEEVHSSPTALIRH